MKNLIENKTALITGASSGIGKQLAIDFAKLNVNLVLVSRNIEKLKELKSYIENDINKKIKISVYVLDIQNSNDVNLVLTEILKKTEINILINNAGLALGMDSIDEGNIFNWNAMIDTNIKGLLYVSREVIGQMKSLNTGHVVNIGSVAGKISYPNGNVYCATKAAVYSLGDSMNADLLNTNIKVSTIAPGAVETNFSNIRFDGDIKKANNVYKGYVPLNAEDISNAIINVINTPAHVNIQYLDIMPTNQRNPYLIKKN